MALLAVTFFYVLVLLVAFRQTYLENDNLGILYDLQHGYTVSFMSVLLGKILTFLYLSVSDAVPWYGLVLYVISGIALYLMLLSLDTLCRNRWLKNSAFVLVLVFFSRFIVTVSYNAASIAIGFSCLLALMVYLRAAARPRTWVVLVLGFLFSFSYLVRIMGLRAVLIFGAVAVGYEVITRVRKSFLHFALFLLPLILVYGADVAVQKYAVSDEHRAYKEWNSLRGKFHGFPVSHLNVGNEEILRVNRWRPIDYQMLLNWAFFDERRYNTETLQNVFEYSVPLPSDNGIMYGAIAGNGLELLGDYWRFWIVLVALAGYTYYRYRRVSLLLQAAQAMALLAGGAVLATYMHFPDRVAYVMFFGIMLMAFYLAFRDEIGQAEVDDDGWTIPTSRYLKSVSLVVLVVAASEVPVTVSTTIRRSEHQVQYYASVEKIRALKPAFLLLQAGSTLGAQFQDPLRVHNDRLPSVPGGWTIFSPRFYEFLEGHGLNAGQKVVPRLVRGEHAYVVSSRHFVRLMARYLQDTYRWRTKPVLVEKLSARTGIYQIRITRKNSTEGPQSLK